MSRWDRLRLCKKCNVFTNNLARHKQRNRCEAVEARRLERKG